MASNRLSLDCDVCILKKDGRFFPLDTGIDLSAMPYVERLLRSSSDAVAAVLGDEHYAGLRHIDDRGIPVSLN